MRGRAVCLPDSEREAWAIPFPPLRGYEPSLRLPGHRVLALPSLSFPLSQPRDQPRGAVVTRHHTCTLSSPLGACRMQISHQCGKQVLRGKSCSLNLDRKNPHRAGRNIPSLPCGEPLKQESGEGAARAGGLCGRWGQGQERVMEAKALIYGPRLCHPGATASGSTPAGLAWIQRSYQALSTVGSLPIRTARTPLQGPSATKSCLLPCSGRGAGHIPPPPAKNDWDQTQAPRAQAVPSMEAAAWLGSSSSSLHGEEQSSARCPLTAERHLTRPAGCPALVWVPGANRAQPGPCSVERGHGGHSGEAARLCSQSRDGRGQTPEEHGRRWGHTAPSRTPSPPPQTSEPGQRVRMSSSQPGPGLTSCSIYYLLSQDEMLQLERHVPVRTWRHAAGKAGGPLRDLPQLSRWTGGLQQGSNSLQALGTPNLPGHSGSPLFCPIQPSTCLGQARKPPASVISPSVAWGLEGLPALPPHPHSPPFARPADGCGRPALSR